MKVLVLTISDRASRGEYEDKSGPVIAQVLADGLPDAEVSREIVSDNASQIESALSANLDMDAIITTGGTGIGPGDCTPDVTGRFCDRLIPGIAEMLRSESLSQTRQAALSRATAGVKGATLVINVPGSTRAAEFCAGLLVPLIPHAVKMLAGEGH